MPISPPPTNGPVTPPSRKLLDHKLVDRPRSAGGASRINSATAETVNMVDPTPPSDHKTDCDQDPHLARQPQRSAHGRQFHHTILVPILLATLIAALCPTSGAGRCIPAAAVQRR